MSVKEQPMYSIVCDHDGCEYDTFDCNGEFAGWADHGQARDDWVNGDLQVIVIDGQEHHYCDAHRVPQCSECEGPGQPLDVHDEGFCETCAAEDEAVAAR